jgi:hypothetical protein
MNHAFVLGNGRSRMAVEPNRLKSLGKLYGCNALYRDCDPDYLVAVDPKMVLELTDKAVHTRIPVWTNINNKIKNIVGLNLFDPSKGWSSGPTALWLASTHGYETVYILGFDYVGLNDKLNNVYADTPNYRRSVEPATFHGNWQRQTESVIKEFTKTKYIRVIEPGAVEFGWKKYDNYSIMTYDEFKSVIFY